nr:MAG TPA: dUTPase [Caudoviricetes sp.]
MSSIKWHTEDERLLPVRATKNSVGYDFKAPNTVTIAPKETVIIDTLVACNFSNDLWLGIYGRSSFAQKRLINPLGVGVIDPDYFATGNTIKIVLFNIGYEEITIKKGEAIAQGIFHSVNIGDDIVTTERLGGFGSSDVKDEYPLTVEIYGKKYKAKYVRNLYHSLFGILVYGTYKDIIFISKDKDGRLHDAWSFFRVSTDVILNNHCWFFGYDLDLVVDATKEEASNDFIESLLVKEG